MNSEPLSIKNKENTTQDIHNTAIPVLTARGSTFSFTRLCPPPPVIGYAQQGDVIIEHDGIFSISSKLETSAIKLDPTFKQLVDSILF